MISPYPRRSRKTKSSDDGADFFGLGFGIGDEFFGIGLQAVTNGDVLSVLGV